MLTMGLFWWPWALLVLVLYLPWRWIDRLMGPGAALAPTSWHSHRKLFVGTTCFLLVLHLFAVLSQREFEPLYSNYPMYAGELRAGTRAEAQFWRDYSAEDRNWRPIVKVVSKDKTLDVSRLYALAEFGARYHLYRSSYADFSARELLVSGNTAADVQLCKKIQQAAKSAVHLDAISIIYGKHYYTLADGIVSWLPENEIKWITIDLRNCSLGMEKATISAAK
jgi:hypothetical protein